MYIYIYIYTRNILQAVQISIFRKLALLGLRSSPRAAAVKIINNSYIKLINYIYIYIALISKTYKTYKCFMHHAINKPTSVR